MNLRSSLTPRVTVTRAALIAVLAPSPRPRSQRDARASPPSCASAAVYVPEGTKDWPKGNVKYLPMEAAEFERLLEAIQRTAPGLPAQSAAGLVAGAI